MKRLDETLKFKRESKKVILIFLLAINLYFADGLQFFLSLEKDTVYICEDIEALLVVKNLSQEPQQMLKPTLWWFNLNSDFRIQVISASNDTLFNLFSMSATFFNRSDQFLTIQPGDSLVKNIEEIYVHYSLPLQSSTGKKYNGVSGFGLPPGTYRMRVKWKKIHSNIVEFTVRKPKGNMAKAFDLYLKAFTVADWRNLKYSNWESLRNIAEKFEKDTIILVEPYAPMVYNLYLKRLLPSKKTDKNTTEIVHVSKKLIENFPNHKFSYDWLFRGVCRFESKDSFNDYLKYLNEKFPNTLVGNVAKVELEKVKGKPKKNGLNDQ